MLPSELVADNGLKIIEENPDLSTNIRLFQADLDIAGAYPTNEVVFNVSKETTHKEVISIEGVDENTKRMCGINLSGGVTNSVEFCTGMFKMPTMSEWLVAFNHAT